MNEEKNTNMAAPSEIFMPIWYDGKHINEVLFCEDFLREHPMRCIHGKFFTVNGQLHSEAELERQVMERARDFLTDKVHKTVRQIIDAMRIVCCSEPLPLLTDRIHVANGTYFLDGRFTEDKEFCVNRLPVAYVSSAPPPTVWLRFLSELLETEDIPTLQEFMGYCLIPSTKGQTMMLLKGNGGEGKSRIGLVLRALLGGNMKNGSISKLESSPFARADLEHELAMVDDDMKLEALTSTHYLKSLITAEMPMDLERKGIQSYQGEMYVRFLAFSNGDLEALYDHSDGFYRRQLILSVKKKPKNRDDDPYIAEKMCAEAEGILLWCLDGLKRLIANDYRFTESSRTKENRDEARKEANNIIEFLNSDGYIRLKADCTVTSEELYGIYTLWCRDNAYKPKAAITFSKTLVKNADAYNLEHSNKITNSRGRQVNGFWGIQPLVSPIAVI